MIRLKSLNKEFIRVYLPFLSGRGFSRALKFDE
jgi:hypothetical protein